MNNLLTMPAPQDDTAVRRLALDVTRSWIVEAPAGSGKTGLLLQRYLALLASEEVTSCEEVLAITFTRAATDEIRGRLLSELRGAAADTPVQGEYAATTRALARTVLERDRMLSWGLLDDPRRLRVQTIDALCSAIARALPMLSRGAGGLSPVEDAESLHREAARRTMLRLGRTETSADRRLSEALRTILLHRDGDLETCESLLAQMLGSREQWGELLPLALEEQSDESLDREVRPKLDRALKAVICDGLTRVLKAFPAGALDTLSGIATELSLAPAATLSSPHPFMLCRDLVGVPAAEAEFLEHWKVLLRLLVTRDHSWRKAVHGRLIGAMMEPHQIQALRDLIASLADAPELLDAMEQCLHLPPATYPDDQWAVTRPLLRVLHQAVFELEEVFDERGVCDFVQPALLARTALDRVHHDHTADEGSGLRALLGVDLKHLLVDEMQDTSSQQYDLLERLTADWDGRTRTVFLVGDPKQSIYLFRHARVERFLEAMRTRQLGDVPLGLLRLTANFRSRDGLVAAANETFRKIFPKTATTAGQVEYTAAVSTRAAGQQLEREGYGWHITEAVDDGEGCGSVVSAQARRDAKLIRSWLEKWRVRPLPPGRVEPWRTAVLVQNRRSLDPILRELRAGEPLPFRAVQIEALADRREILDLLALTRALLHSGDRIAWLAVLHAPWCGLGVGDLHVLTGADAPGSAGSTMLDLVAQYGVELGMDSMMRLDRVWPILRGAVDLAGELRTPELVERTWRSLGGNLYLEEAAAENAHTYLQLLRTIDGEVGEVNVTEVSRRLKRLYAAPTTGQTSVDLMTIHRAKGLEWDAVIVPELERAAPHRSARLLEWEELSHGRGVILAPITGKGEESQALHRWIRRLHAAREKAERKRLFYVACTRAREELHLVGTAVWGKKELTPRAQSLLEAAWPAAMQHLEFQKTMQPSDGRGEGLSLAAAGEPEQSSQTNDQDEAQERPAMLERVPAGFAPLRHLRPVLNAAPAPTKPQDARSGEHRGHGSFEARALGNVVHAMLEFAASRFVDGLDAEQVLREAARWRPRYATLLRAEGLAPREVDAQSDRVRMALDRTLSSPIGAWILRAGTEARVELPMTTWNGERRRAHRMDRTFLAGATPNAAGATHRWIIDYKTTVPGREGLTAFLGREQLRHGGQMERYAAGMTETNVRVGLWFPLLGQLRWWAMERGVAGIGGAKSASRGQGTLELFPSLSCRDVDSGGKNVQESGIRRGPTLGDVGGSFAWAGVSDVEATHPEDNVFGDIRGVITDTLEVARDDEGIEGLRGELGLLSDQVRESVKGVVVHLVDLVVEEENGAGELDISVDEGLKRLADHGGGERGELGDVDW